MELLALDLEPPLVGASKRVPSLLGARRSRKKFSGYNTYSSETGGA